MSISSILVILFSVLFIRRYIEPDASKCVTFLVSQAISLGLFSLILIPIDIYIVSGNLDDDGMQLDPHLVHNNSKMIQYIYYAFYFTLSAFITSVLPFTFFYVEESNDEDTTIRERICWALKHTAGFILVLIVLVVTGFLLKKNKGGESHDWINDISESYTDIDAIISFLIGAFSCIGILLWITYTAYGMAALPIQTCRKAVDKNSYKKFKEGQQDLATKVAINRENQRYLASSLNSAYIQDNIHKLRKDNEVLHHRLGKGPGDDEYVDSWVRGWNRLTPIRFLFGLIFFFLGSLIIVSLSLTTIDKFLNSSCKYSCGFAIDHRHIINPTDMILTITSSYFPLDLVIFALLIIYVFACSVYGISSLGIRFCGFQIYKLIPQATLSNAMILSSWLLIFIVILVNMELVTVAPHYVHFGGNQYYYPLNSTNSTNFTNTINLGISTILENSTTIPQLCTVTTSINATGHDQCIMSQIGIFVNKIFIQLPFFGVIIFFSNAAFLVMYFLFLIIVLFKCHLPSFSRENKKEDNIWDDPDW